MSDGQKWTPPTDGKLCFNCGKMKEQEWNWFCFRCTKAKEDAYVECRARGITNYGEVVAERDKALEKARESKQG